MTLYRKPVHFFAAILWVAAVLAFTLDVAAVASAWQARLAIPPSFQSYMSDFKFWLAMLQTIVAPLPLAAYGFIIELLDQLRWSAVPAEERSSLGSRYLIARLRGPSG